MIRVKICGIQRPDHALIAAEAGADFIGLVFVPGRRRCLSIDAARAIVDELKTSLPSPPKVVGLFAEQPLEDVNCIIDSCRLDLVQLCGRESLEYCGRVAARVIKVIHVESPPNPSARPGEPSTPEIGAGQAEVPPFSKGGSGGISAPTGPPGVHGLPVDHLAQQVRPYREAGHLVTLDRLVEGLQGGTGRSFSWDIAAELSQQGHSFLLAGGLTPDNVARAVAWVRPWGVDVSSGVETGGVKDPDKVRAFIQNSRMS